MIFDKKLELRVLKTALHNKKSGTLVFSQLKPEHFIGNAASSALHRVLKTLKEKETTPTWDELLHDIVIDETSRNVLKNYNGKPFKTTAGIKGALNTLETFRRSRVLVKMAKNIIDATNTETFNVDELTEVANTELSKARKGSSDTETLIHVGVGNNSNQLVKKILEGEGVTLIPTGFSAWDDKNGGLPLGGVLLVGGATGKGKTALALQMHRNFTDHGISSAFTALEMNHAATYMRNLASISGVDMGKLMNAKKRLSPSEKNKVAKAHLDRVAKLKRTGTRETYFVPDGDITMGEALRTLHPYGYIVKIIDYVGLLAGVGGDRQWQALGEAVREAAIHARNTNSLVVILAQLTEDGIIKYSKNMTDHVQNFWTFKRSQEDIDAGLIRIKENKGRNLSALEFFLKADMASMTYSDISDEEAKKLLEKSKGKNKNISADVDDAYFDDPGFDDNKPTRKGVGSYEDSEDDNKSKKDHRSSKTHRGKNGGSRREIDTI